MDYKTNFIDSLRFFADLYPEAGLGEDYFAAASRQIDALTDPSHPGLYDRAEALLLAMAEHWLDVTAQEATHRCHLSSAGFLVTWEGFPFANEVPLAVTIGNVRYREQDLYGTTRERIDATLAAGPSDQTLDMHVWLTLQNMTVLDLTIKSSLAAMGLRQIVAGESPVLLWRETDGSEFSYEPLLVHNRFADLVDSCTVIRTGVR